ncbi:hypothetical protein ANO11243_084380 [Dothideomycetidae sp. 11243]|nr:hypothetical protein ANO11243_084380 [fungal sp. No.11243]
MTEVASQEGTIPFEIASIGKQGHTFYKVFGDLSPGVAPIVLIHGGPGSSHKYNVGFAGVWPRFGVPMILYDGVGCGKSTRLDEYRGSDTLWQPSLFLSELDNLLDHFGLRDGSGSGYYLSGSCFGAMIATEHATFRLPGLKGLILNAPTPSTELAIKSQNMRIRELPEDTQRVLLAAKDDEDYETKEYKHAQLAYVRHCICRNEAILPLFEASFSRQSANVVRDSVYFSFSTLTILFVPGTGSYRNWDITADLHKINVPTLCFNGETDMCGDVCLQPYLENVPRVRWLQFAGATHGFLLDDPKYLERWFSTVGDFLHQRPVEPKTWQNRLE